MTSPHILVMSESAASARAVSGLLAERACHSHLVQNEAEALLRVRQHPAPDLVLLELNGGKYSLRTLENLLRFCPEVKIVVVSDHHETRQIVEAIRLGARDFLTIPVGCRELEQVIRRHAQSAASRSLSLVRETVEDLGDGQYLVAASAAMRRIRSQAERLAHIDAPVLILGENWTGKAGVARLIHKLSARSRERFLQVNCAASAGEMLERELFGGEEKKPSAARQGKIELCHLGTLLLNEALALPARLQAQLLQVLQERQYFRLGEDDAIQADARILAATNTEGDAGRADSNLCEDLYYRLSAFVIQLPPLRERREDMPALLQNFMARLAAQYSRPPVAFSRAALDACLHYSWPGNLRELENFVKRYLVMGEEAIAHGELRSGAGRQHAKGSKWSSPKGASARQASQQPGNEEGPACHLKALVRNIKDEAEIRAIRKALQDTGWNRKRAAKLLDISYRGLLYKIRQHSLTEESEWDSATPVRQGPYSHRVPARHLDSPEER
ncbi:MAG TPA: sigma 54-interacting transcriptional regulator [Candidatus Sulfotelmatobacter sp.]